MKGTLFGAALAALPLLAAPPLIRGFAANEWVSYYAALEALPRPRKAAARRLVMKAEEAMRNLAPLPQASEAAIRALEIAQRTEHQDEDRVAALAIYEGIQEASARVRSRLLSGAGFAVIEARAATLRDAARKAAAPSAAPR
jgi:hypothetical protein